MNGGGRTVYYMIEGYIIEITMRLHMLYISCIMNGGGCTVYYMIEGYIIEITMILSCILQDRDESGVLWF